MEAARETAVELRATRPDVTLSAWQSTPFRADADQLARDVQSLQAVGLPAWRDADRGG